MGLVTIEDQLVPVHVLGYNLVLDINILIQLINILVTEGKS